MTSKRLEKRGARWQELRERANDAAATLYMATVRMTNAQHNESAKSIDEAVRALTVAEQRYARARSVLADFVAKSVKS